MIWIIWCFIWGLLCLCLCFHVTGFLSVPLDILFSSCLVCASPLVFVWSYRLVSQWSLLHKPMKICLSGNSLETGKQNFPRLLLKSSLDSTFLHLSCVSACVSLLCDADVRLPDILLPLNKMDCINKGMENLSKCEDL